MLSKLVKFLLKICSDDLTLMINEYSLDELDKRQLIIWETKK
jgi:hypothetical protein